MSGNKKSRSRGEVLARKFSSPSGHGVPILIGTSEGENITTEGTLGRREWFRADLSPAKALIFALFAALLLTTTSAFAMGERPTTVPTWEGSGITIKFVRAFGLPGRLPGQFFYPFDVATPPTGDQSSYIGDIFVADTGNDRIQRLEQDGDFLSEFGRFGTGADAALFNQPVGVAVSPNSRVYVSDRSNHRIALLDIWGNPVKPKAFIGGTGGGPFTLNNPAGIATDIYGEIYVADAGNDRIIKFREDGTFLKSIGGFGQALGSFDGPQDIAVDKDRNIYVADTGNHRVQKIDPFDRPLFAFGGKGTGPGQMLFPSGVAVNDKYIFVVDTGNDRVQIFDQTPHLVATFGGSGNQPGQFQRPQGIAFVPPHKIFVADTGNHRMQVFEMTTP